MEHPGQPRTRPRGARWVCAGLLVCRIGVSQPITPGRADTHDPSRKEPHPEKLLGKPGEPDREATPPPKPQVITSLGELRALTPEEADQALPIEVTAVVTYAEKHRDLVMIQNEDGAAFVNFRREGNVLAGRRGLDFETGDRIRIRGVTDSGDFAPAIWHPEKGHIQVQKRGKAPLPEPIRLFPTVLVDPALENMWVEVSGVVTGVGPKDGRTVIRMHDGFDAYELLIRGHPDPDALPPDLINSRIRARGVFGALADENREIEHVKFYIPGPRFIEVVERGAESIFATEPLSFEMLTGYQAVTGKRLHVEGVVTAAYPPRRLYLRLPDGPLEIHTNQEDLPVPGTRLGVAGYRGLSQGTPYLHTAALRPLGTGPQPEPYPVSIAAPVSSMRHGELVAIEAMLTDTLFAEERSLLQLDDGLTKFTAELPGTFENKASAPPEGSKLRVTGILLRTGEELTPAGFQLQLRDPEDIVILERPPFWTAPRIAASLAAFALSTLGLAGWSVWLTRLVRKQTRLLAEKSEAEKVQEERNRISRELHDILEQDLVALNMQLTMAGDFFETGPDTTRKCLASARRILSRTRMESRHSIRELREEEVTNRDLRHTLERLVEGFRMDSGTLIELDPPPACDLDAKNRRHVTLILREALHNAIRHSGAEEIEVSGRREDNDCVLEIRDTGCGFDLENLPSGHFGVIGMRERAGLLNARLDIQSAPGKGATVRLTLINAYSPPHSHG